jgi:hypothetical protein
VSFGSWIGVDLDGTLAFSDQWRGRTHIGAPIPAMLIRVKDWLANGKRVKIFTARVSGDPQEAQEVRDAVTAWLVKHGLPPLEVTCVKDYGMSTLWDDRAVHVIPNTGNAIGACRATGFSSY